MKNWRMWTNLALCTSAAALALALPAPAFSREAARATATAVSSAPAGERGKPFALEGVQNFRDLGGYATEDGSTVRWGLLFRSASLYAMTPNDLARVQKLRLGTVIDFRSAEERRLEPSPWPADTATEKLSEDYSFSLLMAGNAHDLQSSDSSQLAATMVAMYPKMLTMMSDQYRRMFDRLLTGRSPLLFHCSAGRDRTGVAATLLLTALGVPRETIIQDYLLTDRYYDIRRAGPTTAAWGRISDEHMRMMRDSARPSIEAIFQVMDSHPGGAMGYLRDEMGLDQMNIQHLRALYTERPNWP